MLRQQRPTARPPTRRVRVGGAHPAGPYRDSQPKSGVQLCCTRLVKSEAFLSQLNSKPKCPSSNGLQQTPEKGSPGHCQPVIQPAWPSRRSLRRSTREAAQPQVNVTTRSRSAAVQEKLEQDNSDSDIARAIKVAGDLTKLNQTFSQSHSIFLDLPRRKVFRYENIVIKFGLDVSPYKAKILRFIDETTNIPVPRPYYDHVHSEGTVVNCNETR